MTYTMMHKKLINDKHFISRTTNHDALLNEDFNVSVIRAIACIMVIIMHVAAINFPHFLIKWWPTNVYDSFVRSCVPLFLMISGALLLRKKERLSVFVRKRFLRIIPPLLFWSIIYLLWLWIKGNGNSNWLSNLFLGPVVPHLWYLYAIIGIYSFIPMLRIMFNGSSNIEKNYYLGFWFVFTSIYPTTKKYFCFSSNIIDTYHLIPFAGYAGYLFLGAYLYDLIKNGLIKVPFILSTFLFGLASFFTCIMTYEYSMFIGTPNELFYDYLSPFVILAAIAAFNLFMNLKIERVSPAGKALGLVSDCALGVYCIHPFAVNGLAGVFGLSGTTGNPWWSIPVTSLLVLLLSIFSILIMRKIPLMRYVT